jgi:hypothetical protein
VNYHTAAEAGDCNRDGAAFDSGRIEIRCATSTRRASWPPNPGITARPSPCSTRWIMGPSVAANQSISSIIRRPASLRLLSSSHLCRRLFCAGWTATKDDGLWLYNDATASRVDYFERLGRLMSQKVRVVGKEPRQDHTANPYQPPTASLEHADDAQEMV